jgi:hypothetical protein
VYVLESSGVPADDTTATVGRRDGRVVILRRGAPDNSLFAELVVPMDSAGPAGQVTIDIRPRPGLYGVDLSASGPLAAGTRLTFSYGFHFVAPAGARQRYGSDLAFEQALHVARVDGGQVTFLPSTRPGSDLLSAIIPGPGRYLVAALRP